ncbi:tetratricopeptide repeat protein [Micromonospora echinospora]|uniref:tetratricopeptide repeat protein n=1 Tax=Micromonospora echinospora TaxID=1877 RepID=UPI0023EA65BE|nr:tetratricopeptide repeat protein [Micromonospora echinospora]
MSWRSPARDAQTVTASMVFGPVIQIRDVAGNVTVVADRPPYQIGDFTPGAVPLPVGTARRQPSRLLLARHQVVPFTGRDAELDALNTWMGGAEPVSVRLVHAAGGQGKTRLARHVAAQAHAAGWLTWRVLHTPEQQSAGSRWEAPGGGGALVVVDYADRWPASDLNRLVTDLHAVSLRTGLVLRVLLLARSAGFWWAALRDRLDSEHAITAEGHLLPPLDEHTDRAMLFDQARERFGTALDVPDTAGITVPDLAGDGFRQILAVHMAALVAVDAHHHGQTPPAQPHALSAYLLNRERAHWHHLHARTEDRRPTSPEVMGRAVYLATLAGPVTRDDATTILTRTRVTEPGVATIIDDHRFCYPPDDPGTVLHGLRPDRLGEDLIALSTPGHPHTGADDWQPDDWAATAAATLLTGEPATWAPGAVTVLVETAHRWPHIADTVLYPLIRQHPELALAAGGATITRLAELPHADITALEAVDALLPAGRHVDLDTAAAAISTALTHHRLGVATDPAEQARLLGNHSARLANAGRSDEALTPAEESADMWRRLAEEKPAAYLSHLALSLSNLGVFLSRVGRRDEAVAVAEEAVGIRRRLVEADPAAYLPGLAASLGNLGIFLSGVGRRDEALLVAEEAAGVYRRLVEADPAAYLPDFAASLDNLGNLLSGLGRRDQAVAVAEETIGIRRRLVGANPAAYLPELALSLSNFGAFLSRVGRRDEALFAGEEAAGVYRRLVGANPAAHLPDLARALTNLGPLLSGVGRRDEALLVAEEAAGVYRRLVEANPVAYLPGLAGSLINLGASLSGLGRYDEAAAATEEAAGISRRLVQANPVAYLPDLALSLNNLGMLLSGLGRRHEALAAAEEAAGVYRRLAEVNPAAHLPALAKSLRAHSQMCVDVEANLPQALETIAESIEIYRFLAAQLPQLFKIELIRAYRTLADLLEGLGRRDEADSVRRQLNEAVGGTQK